VTILIQNGANINFVKEQTKMTPLHWAAFNNDKDTVSYLLNHGAIMTYAFDG
jgi:ankyrin repeat protein